MASFAVDAEGQRIKTDILVSGYIRHNINQYGIQIPDELIGLFFLLWFIDVCDNWDELSCHQTLVDIDGACVQLNENYEYGKDNIWGCTIYGSHVVREEVFKWCLEFKTAIHWICIGIIVDKKEEIEKNKHSNEYGIDIGCGCFWFNSNGWLQYDDKKDYDYSSIFVEEGTMIEMTLDMNNQTIQYKINDTECKTVKIDSLSKQMGYRLAVTLTQKDNEIQLL